MSDNRRLTVFRPTWIALVGFAPIAVIALMLATVALLPINRKNMELEGLLYLVFPAVLFLLALGIMTSLVSVVVTAKHSAGLAWATTALTINALPFCLMMRPFFG